MLKDSEIYFRKGLTELLYLDPNLGALARGMGMPVIDNSIETASLKWDAKDNKIVFVFNEEFLENASEEMIASIILHETEHLIFDHIPERLGKSFDNKEILHMAQECINNDIINNIYQLPLPDSAITGLDLIKKDCSSFSTKQVYDLIMQQIPPGEQPQPGLGGNKGGKPQESNKGYPGEGNKGGCGGIQIDSKDSLDVDDYLKDLISSTASQQNMTYDEFMDDIYNTKNGGYSPTGTPVSGNNSNSSARMNWNYLLAKINPKVLKVGRKRKIKYDWTKQNRRLISSYPKSIIPKTKTHDPNPNHKGDSIPVFVIALDLSGSIPTGLVGMLQGLLEDIPEKLIKVYPCTWGTSLVPYEPGGKVAYGSTYIENVVRYVKQIQDETGTEPYVLVITDGVFRRDYERPGKDWFFMAIDNRSYKEECAYHAKDKDHLYHVKDFVQ